MESCEFFGKNDFVYLFSGAKHRFSSGIGSKKCLSWKKLFFPGNASKWELIREEEWLAMAYVVFDLRLVWLMDYFIPPAWAGVTPKPS